ncbi:MAG: vWA domain-containing protein [bacterium]
MNEFLNHWIYFEPEWYVDFIEQNERSVKDLIKIFYIARVLFREDSSHPVYKKLSPLFNKKKDTSPEKSIEKIILESSPEVKAIDDCFRLNKITSLNQISTILPREFLTNSDLIFCKKLLNRELFCMCFESPQEKVMAVDDLMKGDSKAFSAQKIYILFDNSSSMAGDKMQKYFIAKTILLEYLRKVSVEEPHVYFRSFNAEPGDLFKACDRFELKNLIKNIINLELDISSVTNIGKAILQAIHDIKSDLRLVRAEILIITDGLSHIPEDIKELLGFIRLNVILIPTLSLEEVLGSYPTRPSWWNNKGIWESINLAKMDDKDRKRNKERIRELWDELDQVYKLHEVADFFITVPSESFTSLSFSEEELRCINEARLKIEGQLRTEISGHERFIIYKRIDFMMRYLFFILKKKLPPELHRKVLDEYKEHKNLKKDLMKDKKIIALLNIKLSAKNYKFSVTREDGPRITVSLARIFSDLCEQLIIIINNIMTTSLVVNAKKIIKNINELIKKWSPSIVF